MNPLAKWIIGWALVSAASALGQRSFNIAASANGQNGVVVSWPVQSATPVGDLILLPQYQVQRSADLESWAPVSPILTGTLQQILTLADSNQPAAFFRVQSVISQEYGQFGGAVLDGGQLAGADFFGAEFFGASLDNASLGDANLSATDLRSASLQGADLTGANLFFVEASSAAFDGATLAGADARYGDFQSATFAGTILSNADFRSADLTSANLNFANLRGMILDTNTLLDPSEMMIWNIVNFGAPGANLDGQNLSAADLTGVNFNGSQMVGANLDNSELQNADLRNVNLSGANLAYADFQDTLINSNTVLAPEWLLVWQILNQSSSNRILTNQNLNSAFLEGANLNGAMLNNASLAGADLAGADIRGANFSGATLFQVELPGAILNASTVLDAGSLLAWQILNQGGAGRNLASSNLRACAEINASTKEASVVMVWDDRIADRHSPSLRRIVKGP